MQINRLVGTEQKKKKIQTDLQVSGGERSSAVWRVIWRLSTCVEKAILLRLPPVSQFLLTLKVSSSRGRQKCPLSNVTFLFRSREQTQTCFWTIEKLEKNVQIGGAARSANTIQALASRSSRKSLCMGTRPSCLMLQKCWTARAAV